MNNLLYLLFHEPKRILAKIWSVVGLVFSDATYLKVRFRLLMGKKLNLKNPQTFSEKLQWLKLYDRRPEYTTMVDKYAVKKYVSDIIGADFVIPTLGVWDRPEDIDFNSLPDQFVLKTTHGGGSWGVVICKDKKQFDKKEAIRKLKTNMKSDWRIQMEWPYKNVPHRVIAEKYIKLESGVDDLPDYKFFCFNGEPKYCQVISGRSETMCIDFFDYNWIHQPFHEPKNYPFAPQEPVKPICLDEMWKLARKLAGDRAFSRIDFYQAKNKVLFGEITFYPTSGMGGFSPDNWDEVFGNMLILPNSNNNHK